MVLKFFGAILLTYFFSRLAMALPLPGKLVSRVAGAHCISLAAIALVLFALRSPLGAFEARQLVIFPPPQFFWMCYDLFRQYRPKSKKSDEMGSR